MISTAKTYRPDQIEWIKPYINSKHYKESQAGKILEETGGTFAFGGPIFLWDNTTKNPKLPAGPCCHFKAEGDILCAPNYTAFGAAWNGPADYQLAKQPSAAFANYLQCVTMVKDGKIVTPLSVHDDMRYACPRQVIGQKEGRFAYLVINGKYTPQAIAELIVSYGWDWAVLLDGGGSTCYVDADGGAIRCDPGRVLYSYIVVKLRAEPAKPLTENDVKRERVLSAARAEIGVTELPAGSNRVKYNNWFYGRVVSGASYPWCMVWDQYVFAMSSLPLPVKTASCTQLANYAKAHGQWVTKGFKPGDIAFMHFNKSTTATEHTGIVESAHSTYLTTIEGNTSLTSQDNGGAVMRRNRAYSVITGAYRPWYNM